ncbi:uncharacterized protein B0I36DRAFT_347177 [Microdochium trichocladiopsis]|uniref:GPI anchored serine-rich protein n=1 Tax=Microdochium trichocladiopsis TaxID=1682393 RepID=A0A9P9BTD7_9PEZI|nr:uncharacterized protein B0I36DRAFT_347177 [Microdochium trichocladiopsis]KAH7035387.1 hypothetical protein B0I36DRAFT_347177 [Microdochium trichocladiopsis]
MRVLSILALAAGIVSANYEVTSYSTSTQYLTATVTLTQCNPANPECPLYTPPPTTSSSTSTSSTTTSSSIHINTTSVFTYPVHNTTSTKVYPTTHLNSTVVYPTAAYPTTAPPYVPTTASPAPSQPTIPVGGAGALAVQSGLLMGVLGLGAALLA